MKLFLDTYPYKCTIENWKKRLFSFYTIWMRYRMIRSIDASLLQQIVKEQNSMRCIWHVFATMDDRIPISIETSVRKPFSTSSSMKSKSINSKDKMRKKIHVTVRPTSNISLIHNNSIESNNHPHSVSYCIYITLNGIHFSL